jgi:hypothetical protein
MDQGVATVPAALIAVAGAGLTGLAGVALGGRISGNAAREAATIADAARESALASQKVAEADREEARAARFADRERELAGEILAGADRFESGCSSVMAAAYHRNTVGPLPEIPDSWRRAAQELRLLVRLPSSYQAIFVLDNDLTVMEWFSPGELVPAAPNRAEAWASFLKRGSDYRATRTAFEDAIRLELGRQPIERPSAPSASSSAKTKTEN